MVRKIKKETNNISPIFIKMKDNEYIINFDNETPIILERYYKGIDFIEEDNLIEAEMIFKNLVNYVRGFYDGIVALINIFSEKSDIPNISKVFNIGIKDFNLILKTLPADAKLPFSYSSNKGILKFLYKLGIRQLNLKKIDDSIETFSKLLALNPNDEFDCKEVLAQLYFEKKNYTKILDLHSNNSYFIFNKILAHLYLNNTKEAINLIKNLNFEELKIYSYLKNNESHLENYFDYKPLSITNSKEKFYWNNFYRYWNSHDFLELLKENSPKNDISSNTSDFFETFEYYLQEQDLKEITIKNHIENVRIFDTSIENINLVINKLNEVKSSYSSTAFSKIITSLNKYYSFSIKNKKIVKNYKELIKATTQA
ncbi:MAG: hypothetical protein JW924_01385 [Fusobacteriaceae bacterium]|nr:hypothetical protein [Fusobacteriaceae bacterium]